MVRLLVLLRTRPRLSLVNQTTSFLLLVLVHPDHLFGDALDAEFPLRRKIGRFQEARSGRSLMLIRSFEVSPPFGAVAIVLAFGCRPD